MNGDVLGVTRLEHHRLAEVLLRAAQQQHPIPPLTLRYPELTLADAACIRDAALAHRIELGERVVGAAAVLGATPRRGWLTNSDLIADDRPDERQFIEPRVRPAIAVRISRALRGPAVDAGELVACTTSIHECVVVLASRYRGDGVTVIDDIADNCALSKVFVRPPSEQNGARPQLDGVLWLARELTAAGHEVEADSWLVSCTAHEGRALS